MKIYTKTGDKGMTSLIGGKRVPKNSARLESYGTIDELNSFLGMIRSFPLEQVIAEELVEIQSRLFDVGGNLATDPEASANLKVPIGVTEEDIALLENGIDRMDAEVPPMKYFVLPGGNQCAERRILDLAAETEVDGSVMKYVNRLSDYLFILARKIAYDSGCEEMKWVPRK